MPSVAKTAPALFSVGQLCKRFSAPWHQINYIIRSRDIKEAARIGNSRAFDEDAAKLIGHELTGITESREARKERS